jgi:hypothetical protein
VISALIAYGLPGAAGLAGFVAGRVTRRVPGPPGQSDAICPCAHPVSFHQKSTGACTGEVRRRHYDSLGNRAGTEWVACACLFYAGPEVISSVTMRPATFRELRGDEQ